MATIPAKSTTSRECNRVARDNCFHSDVSAKVVDDGEDLFFLFHALAESFARCLEVAGAHVVLVSNSSSNIVKTIRGAENSGIRALSVGGLVVGPVWGHVK